MTTDPIATPIESDEEVDIPAPPRPITRRARRRSWAERPVRLWSILSTLVAFATIYFAIRDISAARRERRLIDQGIVVDSTIELVDGLSNATRGFSRDETRHVKLAYTVPGSDQKYTTEQDLPQRPNEYIKVGQTLPLRVDPDDPQNVTTQTVARPWLASLAVLTLMTPALALVLAVMLWQRQRVLRVWRDGEVATATVVDWHRTGLAPRSDLVRFTVDGSEDGRVMAFFWPHNAGQLNAGDEIEIIHPRGEPSRAIAAEFYV